MATMQFNNTICERDMDMLFIQSVLTDKGFCRLVIDKTDLAGKDFSVLNAELSKTDEELGESDITIIVDIEGVKYGLLIEDKIDAIAMPKQHDRYIKRGEKGIKNGEYGDFRVFIFCPEKYRKNNDEAQLYEYFISYEEGKRYFDDKSDPLSMFRSQQFEQALVKAKKPPVINVDKDANAFLRQYISYQKKYYPSLSITTKEDKNGWWIDYHTELGYVYINHKIQEGYVDLTFPKAAEQVDKAKIIADWGRHHKIYNTEVIKTKKSVMIRINVPKIDMLKGFESVDEDELNQCFEAVKELTDFANIAEMINSITSR